MLSNGVNAASTDLLLYDQIPKNNPKMILWITGISGSGKTTLAKAFHKDFIKKHKSTIYLDGDEFRSLFGNDLKYTIKDTL